MTEYYTGEISQIYRILAAFEKEDSSYTTALVWSKSNIQHARGKPMLYRLRDLGMVESNPPQRLSRGITKKTFFWSITPAGVQFRDILEVYVKP